MAYIILVRHGKSEYNKQGLWTGWTDVSLVEEGREEARRAGRAIKHIRIDAVHVSDLKRTHETWHEIQKIVGLHELQIGRASCRERVCQYV